MCKQKMYISKFIISNKTGPVTLIIKRHFYQENIKHKSGIKFTVFEMGTQL